MASTERSEPAWVAHEMNAILQRLAEKLEVETGHLKSTLKKVAQEWEGKDPTPGCPQNAYLKFVAAQAELAAVYFPVVEPLLRQGLEQDPKVQLVRALLDDSPRPNDWSSLQGDLWALLDKPDLPADQADEAAVKLEVLDSERVLIDAPGGVLTALRNVKEGPWPVYRLDANSLRKEADDLIEWLNAAVEKL
ncbi:MAG TPA: hypothetical protein VGK67_09555 [Myxococcales bacterium]